MSDAPTGRIFDVSRGRVDDGPGLRTVVFLKGCALRCPWCHNPEGISRAPEIAFDAARCIGCGECARACPRTWPSPEPDAWRLGCTACGRCAAACPAQARRLAGRDCDVDGLLREVLTDADFYAGTGGGVTFSGGEPMLQSGFLFAAAAGLRRAGVHVAVETSGLFSARLLGRLAREADFLLWDVKHVDARKLRSTIGNDMAVALRNLRGLLSGPLPPAAHCPPPAPVEVRITLVPGFNDSAADLRAIARWLAGCERIPPVRLLGFHRMAASKQASFARPYAFRDVPAEPASHLDEARRLLEDEGIPAVRAYIRAPSPA
jgi:pyruvate formate lyase activating enzyme